MRPFTSVCCRRSNSSLKDAQRVPSQGWSDARRGVHRAAWSMTLLAITWLLAVTAGGAEPRGEQIDVLTMQKDRGELVGWESFHEGDHTTVNDVWKLEEGVLTCQGTPKGYIHTEQDYKNFVLELDWRLPQQKGPLNGGVLIRMTGPNRIWPKSLEAQINADQAGDFWGLGGYRLDGPDVSHVEHPELGKLTHLKRTVDAEKPRGTWNHYKIIADGSTVTLEINGQVVNRAKNCETEAGKICLTAEGNPIEFRDVTLVPLKE